MVFGNTIFLPCIERVRSELFVGQLVFQHVIAHDEYHMSYCRNLLFLTSSAHKALLSGKVIGAFHLCCRPCQNAF